MTTRLRRPLRLLLTLTLSTATLLAVAPDAADAQASGCAAVGTNFAATGPFAVTVQNESANTYYSPTNLGTNGCTSHPVILWGNGTGTTPAVYDALLRHLASHGFIVAAANTTNAGSGNEMVQGLTQLTQWNGQSGNRFYQRVDTANVGSTGHSQGGGGAINAAKNQGVKTTAPLEPWSGNQVGLQDSDTALFFSGQSDTVVAPSSVRSRYTGVTIPAGYAELAGASHFVPVGDAGGFRGPLTAWMRWQLMGDANGSGLFVGANPGLRGDPAWSAYEANARLLALGGGGPGPGPGTQCFTTTNTAHIAAGRATSFFFIFALAAGSSDWLGVSSATTSLQGSGGTWESVASC